MTYDKQRNLWNNLLRKLKTYYFQNLDSKVVSVRGSFNEGPVLTSIEKYATHPCIKNSKSQMFKSLF